MSHVFNILTLTGIHFMIVKCLIPDLSVQMLDKRLIQRKRQDTLDMCRLFNAETEKLNAASEHRLSQNNIIRRSKRETKIKSTNIDVENAKRVESIVDRLYEDLEENGEKVTYRQRNLDSLTTAIVKNLENKTMRRFNFAPAELLGPLATTERTKLHEMGPPDRIDWPKRWKQGIVPYFIDSKTYDAHLAEVIQSAFEYFEKATCIRLQRLKVRPTDKESLQNVEWLYITNPSGIRQCVHSNERKTNKGVQMVIFGYDCMSVGEIVHEVMHQLGFSHEHTRPDRDQYITVLWNNIKPGYKKYFEARTNDILLNIPYDYASVLHYPPKAFSKNGHVTILAQPGIKLGQREGLSDGDVEKVGIIFGNDCVERNKQYLIKTCPSVVKANTMPQNVTKEEILEYFKDRIWSYGVVNYMLRDRMEFSAEERENIRAVIRHIEKETCIEFKDISDDENKKDKNNNDNPDGNNQDDDNNNDNNNDKNVNGFNGDILNNEDNDHNINPSLDNDNHDNENLDGTNNNLIENNDDQNNNSISNNNNNDGNINDQSKRFNRQDIGNFIKKSDDNKESKTNPIINLNEVSDRISHSNNTKELLRGTHNLELKPKASKEKLTKKVKTRKSIAMKPQRRHAADILILAKSVDPGCNCPPPGKPNGNKVLYISTDCFNSVNDLLHLFVHLLGLDHQHNAYDRDSYLHILWENLTPDLKEEMQVKLPPEASLGFDYDYQSVMHYPWLQIKNGVTNIMYPIWNDGWAMGHWQGLSSTDVFKLNLLYYEQCQKRRKGNV